MSLVEGDVFLSYNPPEAPDWRKCKKRRRAGAEEGHEPAEAPLAKTTVQALEDAKALCWRQAQAVYREVAEEVYGETFAAISTFLEQSRSESSQWGEVLQLLQKNSSSACSSSSIPSTPSPLSHGGFNCLIPCAIVHPNMSVADRPRMVQLLLESLGRRRTSQRSQSSVSPPAIPVTLTPHRHNTLPRIFYAMHEAISREIQRGLQRRGVAFPSRRAPGAASASSMSLYDVVQLYTTLPPTPCVSPSGARVRRRLLLIFTDVEAVDSRLLENLLCLLGEKQLQLPVQLLFLVSASCPFSTNIGSAATSTLQAATFVLPPCSLCFDKLLTRLFLDLELPVILSGRVVRFLRATFLESHLSIDVFFKHLEFILHCHFQHVVSLLCMAPYKPVLEAAADITALLGERSLVLYNDLPWVNDFNDQGFTEISRLVKVQSLRSIPLTDKPFTTYKGILNCIKAQIVARLELWGAATLISQSLKVLQPGGSVDCGSLCMYELMMDVERPHRWAKYEAKLKELIANASLRELDLLVTAWDGVLVSVFPDEPHRPTDAPAKAQQPQANQAQPEPPQSEQSGARNATAGPTEIITSASTEGLRPLAALQPHASWDPSPAQPSAPFPQTASPSASTKTSPSSVSKPYSSPVPLPKYKTGSKALRQWRADTEALFVLIRALSKDISHVQALLNKKTGKDKAATVLMGSGFQSKRMALAARAQQKQDGEGEMDTEEKGAIPPDLEKRLHEFRVKERGVRNAIIELLCDVIEHSGHLARDHGQAHEALWFDEVKELEAQFLPQVRSVTARALSDPHHYLQCRCCKAGEISHTCPDLCIAYTLYEEDPRRNLVVGKLLESFTDITTGKKRRADEAKAEELKLRLQHALLGLETMGFVRPFGSRGEWNKNVYSYTVMQQAVEEGEDA